MKVSYTLLLVLFSLVACAQSKYGIVKARAYAQPVIPGAVQDEDRHKAPDTQYVVYLEVKRKAGLQWNAAFVNDKRYNVLTTKVTSPHTVGVSTTHNDTIQLTAHKGNNLFQVTLEKPVTAKELAQKGLLLKGVRNGKTIYFRIKRIVVLLPSQNE